MKHNPKQLITSREAFIKHLREWYDRFHRKLPWRTHPSVYRTVVSEFMLQQTQVDTVLPYFDRWMRIFPDFATLAQATEEKVVKQWEGLGYYSRARNLHRLAQQWMATEQKPKTATEWLEYPGVGPYSSAAISSIAFNYPAAVVDGNVVRILARLTHYDQEFKSNGDAVKLLTPLANAVLDEKDPGTHNQAMMELGATICFRANPMCTICPVVKFCQSAQTGRFDEFPKIIRKATEKVQKQRLWVVDKGRLLLHQIPSDAKRLANMYELPLVEGFEYWIKKGKLLAKKSRGISNQRITEEIYTIICDDKLRKAIKSRNNLIWMCLSDIHTITLSGPHRKWVEEIWKQRK